MAGKKLSERKLIKDYSDATISRLLGCNRDTMKTLWNIISPLKIFYQEDLIRLMDFITNHQSMFVLANTYSISEKNLRERLWSCLEILTDTMPQLDIRNRFVDNQGVKYLNFEKNSGAYCLTAIENASFPFQTHDSEFKSAKHGNKAELKYQMLVNISNGTICHLHGPYPAAYDDTTLYRESLKNNSSLISQPNEYILADKYFSGEERLICPIEKGKGQPNLDNNEKIFNNWLSSSRQCVKNLSQKYKRYKILNTPFRSNMENHFRIVKLITFIINKNLSGDLLDNVQLPSSFPYAERYLTAVHTSVAPIASGTPITMGYQVNSATPIASGAQVTSVAPFASGTSAAKAVVQKTPSNYHHSQHLGRHSQHLGHHSQHLSHHRNHHPSTKSHYNYISCTDFCPCHSPTTINLKN
ncbi:hypothetical protein DICPUDRAFT_76037 [Dictyostelium purpureum]|uniref:DDE Tnp4 domain-containing protein n=1 Tax=Dictyostelium purpureum TaxID=5786 RepID=F0ZCE5_DICPU|nr:uncharacterized protein DICPUDRAFT_76037 [Dictyostelium purpureum]EGC38408.1 hypothetical protein DICPUDRAFT_76037 [Dictyostelium purpureum]|eukprot:XP_003285069.1 hypothetical protein DICPUDRAFT_76037 [Dictyostelium purpureum]